MLESKFHGFVQMVWIKPILMIEKKGIEQAEEEKEKEKEKEDARTHWNCLVHI
jgi:hypothetical protein